MSSIHLVPYEILAFEIIKRVISDMDITELHQWIKDVLSQLDGTADYDAPPIITEEMIETFVRNQQLMNENEEELWD